MITAGALIFYFCGLFLDIFNKREIFLAIYAPARARAAWLQSGANKSKIYRFTANCIYAFSAAIIIADNDLYRNAILNICIIFAAMFVSGTFGSALAKLHVKNSYPDAYEAYQAEQDAKKSSK